MAAREDGVEHDGPTVSAKLSVCAKSTDPKVVQVGAPTCVLTASSDVGTAPRRESRVSKVRLLRAVQGAAALITTVSPKAPTKSVTRRFFPARKATRWVTPLLA